MLVGHEFIHVSLLNRADNLEIRVQRLLEVSLGEDLAVGDLAHEQLDNQMELLHLETEAEGAVLGTLSLRLSQVV